MTARSVGEVSFRRKFVNLLPDDIRSQVPELFLQEGVCGLITADYLNKHVTHQRDEYQGAEDDGCTIWLLGLLAQVEDQVAEALNIKVRHIDEKDATGRKEVTALLTSLDDRYSQPDQTSPPGGEGENKPKGSRAEGSSGGGARLKTAHFRLNQPEFELGEKIIATLVVSHGSPGDYEVFFDESLAKLVDGPNEGTVCLIAETLGTGKLVARHRVTKSIVKVTYDVVSQRWFRLQAPSVAIVGERVGVNAYNIDKVPGGVNGIEWDVSGGDITLNSEGQSVIFVAEQPGLATVSACAKEDSTIYDDRDILVNRSRSDTPRAFRIRDQFFVLRFDGVMGQERFSKPVTIIKNEGSAHRLTFTTDEPGYVKASQDGVLATWLVPFIAREYADHFYEDDLEDGELYQWSVARLAAEVAAEMFGAREVVVD